MPVWASGFSERFDFGPYQKESSQASRLWVEINGMQRWRLEHAGFDFGVLSLVTFAEGITL
jgi:hypothetical protein